MKYNKKDIIERLKNNPSKTINDNLEIIKDKNIKIESRIFIINVLGRIDWYDTVSFYHLYKKNKHHIKKIKITFQEILKDESENDTVKIEIIKFFENNPLLFGPADKNIIILFEKIISDKYKNEDLRKCAQKTLDSIDSPFKKRKINYHPDVNYYKDSIILKDAIEKSIKKFQEAMEPINYMAKDYQMNLQAISKSYQKSFEDIKKFQEAIEPINEMTEDYQKYLRTASRSSKNYIEFIKKFQEVIEPTNEMTEDYQKYLRTASRSSKNYIEFIKKFQGILKIDEFINAFEYAEKLKKIIKDYAKK